MAVVVVVVMVAAAVAVVEVMGELASGVAVLVMGLPLVSCP